jgi:hypothetical protein
MEGSGSAQIITDPDPEGPKTYAGPTDPGSESLILYGRHAPVWKDSPGRIFCHNGDSWPSSSCRRSGRGMSCTPPRRLQTAISPVVFTS